MQLLWQATLAKFLCHFELVLVGVEGWETADQATSWKGSVGRQTGGEGGENMP